MNPICVNCGERLDSMQIEKEGNHFCEPCYRRLYGNEKPDAIYDIHDIKKIEKDSFWDDQLKFREENDFYDR